MARVTNFVKLHKGFRKMGNFKNNNFDILFIRQKRMYLEGRKYVYIVPQALPDEGF